jgi:DNA-binding PadR family transcriptional regulator
LAILALLAEEPLNGYQIIQRLNDRTGGVWNPSPGSVYPTLSQLSDEGLIETTEDDGKRVFALTSTGVEAAERVTVAPWDSIELFGERQHPEDDPLLFQLEQLGFAVRAAAATGDDVLIESAASLMAGVRRDIYSLLSEAAESQD